MRNSLLISVDIIQNCVIKIHGFVIIKKGEIVRTNLVLHIFNLCFDDNKYLIEMNNFGTLMFVT